VIAKLHRFYGRAPSLTGSWLDVPEWLFSMYDRAQPRLEAEEQQMTLRTLIAGTGHMKQEEFGQYQRQLMRQANGGELGNQVMRPSTPEEMRMLVRAAGFGPSFKIDVKG
jgi:hypothetical protein